MIRISYCRTCILYVRQVACSRCQGLHPIILAVDRELGLIDICDFIHATPAFQQEERDDDKVADRLYAFVEQERRGHHWRVLAIRLVVLV